MNALKRFLSRWEFYLVVLLVLAGAWSAELSPYYLNFSQIMFSTRFFVGPGLLALGLTGIVIVGEIDLSVASTLAIGTIMFSKFSAAGWPILPAVVGVMLICTLLGAINGILVSRFALPSLVVTLGTMGAYRGIAYIIGGQVGYTSFGPSYLWLGSTVVPHLSLPVSFLFFLFAALLFMFLQHGTVYGRLVFSIGNNSLATRFSGIRNNVVRTTAFAAGGAFSGASALIFIGQYASARADNGDGSILFVITAVVLGGVDIMGGSGTVLGVILSLFLLGTLSNGMGLANIAGTTQTIVIGVLLISSILISNLITLRASKHRTNLNNDVDGGESVSANNELKEGSM